MMRSPIRRVDVAASWQHAREQFAAAVGERNEMLRRHLDELGTLRGEIDELRDILALLVTLRREQTETDVAVLRRQLETALVRLAQRDPARPLH